MNWISNVVRPKIRSFLNRRDTPPGNACQVRSGTVITGQCGLILLPPRCLEDQKGLTVLDDQASDLHLLGSGGGI